MTVRPVVADVLGAVPVHDDVPDGGVLRGGEAQAGGVVHQCGGRVRDGGGPGGAGVCVRGGRERGGQQGRRGRGGARGGERGTSDVPCPTHRSPWEGPGGGRVG